MAPLVASSVSSLSIINSGVCRRRNLFSATINIFQMTAIALSSLF